MIPVIAMAISVAVFSASSPGTGQTQNLSTRYGLRPPFYLQLDEDVLDMRLHRLGTDGQILGNFLVGQALGNQSEYVALPRAQLLGNRRPRGLPRLAFITQLPGCAQVGNIRHEFARAAGSLRLALKGRKQRSNFFPLIQNGMIYA